MTSALPDETFFPQPSREKGEIEHLFDMLIISLSNHPLEILQWCKVHGQPATAARADRCRIHLFALDPKCQVVKATIREEIE